MNTNIPAGRQNPPTKDPPTHKNPNTTRKPTQTEEKSSPRSSRQGEQRDHTTSTHRTPTIEAHHTKTASKAKCQEAQKQTKRVIYNRESKKNLQSKGMEDSPLKELNEMEVSKLSDIELKIMVIRMLKELTDNYKELRENYISMKKEIETINKNQGEMNNKISEIKKRIRRNYKQAG